MTSGHTCIPGQKFVTIFRGTSTSHGQVVRRSTLWTSTKEGSKPFVPQEFRCGLTPVGCRDILLLSRTKVSRSLNLVVPTEVQGIVRTVPTNLLRVPVTKDGPSERQSDDWTVQETFPLLTCDLEFSLVVVRVTLRPFTLLAQ